MKAHDSQSGQVLLLIILISTVLLTIGLSVSRLTTEETKIAKLEEDSKRALAAAEAGLEAALKETDVVDLSSLVGSGITGSAAIQTSQSSSFTTPLLQKDDQYTFYLSNYTPADPDDPTSQQQFASQFSGKLKISRQEPQGSYCTDNGGANNFAVELTFINASNGTIVARKLIDSCSTTIVSGTVDKVNFDESIDVSALASDMLIVRVLSPSGNFPGAKLGIVNDDAPVRDWYLQGKTIVSTATTETNVTKKIQLFQTHPQLPLEFWATSL